MVRNGIIKIDTARLARVHRERVKHKKWKINGLQTAWEVQWIKMN